MATLSPRSQAALEKFGLKRQPNFGAIKGVEGSLTVKPVASASQFNLHSGAFNIPTSEFSAQVHSDEHPGVLSHQRATMGTFLSQNEEPIKQQGNI
jgi:hypothetical protein